MNYLDKIINKQAQRYKKLMDMNNQMMKLKQMK